MRNVSDKNFKLRKVITWGGNTAQEFESDMSGGIIRVEAASEFAFDEDTGRPLPDGFNVTFIYEEDFDFAVLFPPLATVPPLSSIRMELGNYFTIEKQGGQFFIFGNYQPNL